MECRVVTDPAFMNRGYRRRIEVVPPLPPLAHGHHQPCPSSTPRRCGLHASYGNCMGWSQMLCALKMWVEHRINAREEMDV